MRKPPRSRFTRSRARGGGPGDDRASSPDARAIAGTMTGPITIARATVADSHDIWAWRNDAQTRAMSLNGDEISWTEHCEWFAQALADRDCHLYLGRTAANEKIGLCRFDVDRNGSIARVSINLNPAARGRHLSHPLLAAAVGAFRRAPNAESLSLRATIKKRNLASLRCFAKCGFELAAEDSEHRYLRLDPR